ncbi:hypothetical protein BV25DRAFT_1834830 [Artomyces pyxidatus]|uniref:Uncharacterized protein n=1 Tax=Artomyces pyxidatus TaxID=48021 RepID=A0ACB8THI1_9AGAM|nr:hypothetical protein BV25DRAFT_1834830 [Artomyces pyxidatus]
MLRSSYTFERLGAGLLLSPVLHIMYTVQIALALAIEPGLVIRTSIFGLRAIRPQDHAYQNMPRQTSRRARLHVSDSRRNTAPGHRSRRTASVYRFVAGASIFLPSVPALPQCIITPWPEWHGLRARLALQRSGLRSAGAYLWLPDPSTDIARLSASYIVIRSVTAPSPLLARLPARILRKVTYFVPTHPVIDDGRHECIMFPPLDYRSSVV